MKRDIYIYVFLMLLTITGTVSAQEYRQQLDLASKHHNGYKFDKAIEIYRSILAKYPDSTLLDATDSAMVANVQTMLVMSENGKSLLEFASSPVLVTKQTFPAESFFLNYPGFGDGTWMAPPQEFVPDSAAGRLKVMNMPLGSRRMVFSAPDETGSWNIMFSTRLNDSLWSAPQIANENITTAGDEILPHLSPCGKILYFSSNGHSGMGGFDLYMSKWNEETGDWDVAQNMGFPFSSTKNDYLYYNTPDGCFTLFSSDRELESSDKVVVYVTQYETLPLKTGISQEKAYKCSLLEPPVQPSAPAAAPGNSSSSDESEYPEYINARKNVKVLQQQLQSAISSLDLKRAEYSNTPDSLQRLSIEKVIRKQEEDVMLLSQQTSAAVNNLQQVELDLLSKGIVPAYTENAVAAAPAAQPAAPAKKFEFARNKKGVSSGYRFEEPEPEMDFSLKIGKEAVIANLSDIPDGLVYHIQLMTAPRKASVKSLRGFSPVFERKVQSGKYTYSVGVFRTYAEALKNLNKVRKNGFPTALITAYNNGKSITVKNAKVLEKQDNSIYRVIIGGYETLPAEALAVIRESTSRDIAKANINGSMKYVIGPFASKSQAENLANALIAKQVSGVEIEKLENK